MRRWCVRLLIVLAALGGLGFEWEGRLGRLRRDLASADPARRREVVSLLASYPAAEVREALLAALMDPDGGVRAEAADAVGRARLTEAVPLLLEWLADPQADVRASAARALGRIGADEAQASLVRALGDSNPDVRRAAVEAIARGGGEAGVVPLLGRLDDPDPRVRVDTATALGARRDPRAVVPLVGRARDDAPEVRAAVHTALGELGEERAVPALIQGLRDDAPDAQLAAIAALGRLGSPAAARPLASLAAGTDGRAARAALAALGRTEGAAAREALIEGLAEPVTRAMAAEALVARARRAGRGGAESTAIVEALADALARSPNPSQVTELAGTLAAISAHEDIAVAAPALLNALRERRSDVPGVVVRALGATGSPEALVPLLEELGSEDLAVRVAVVEGLALHVARGGADGRAADPLLGALARVTEPERAAIVALLGQLRARRALPLLRGLLADTAGELRLAAVRAVGAIGDPEGAPALEALLDDPEPRVRFEAAQALGAAASTPQAFLLLDRVAAREPADRHALLAALALALPRLRAEGALPGPEAARARDTLLALAAADDEALADAALDVVAATEDAEVAPLLVARLARATTRRQLAFLNTLGAIDHDAARGALRAALASGSDGARLQAAARLGEHGGAAEAAALLAAAPELPWPSSAAAAFSLARMARRGVLDRATAEPTLCALAASHDPLVRANVAVAFAALASPPCPDGPTPLSWLDAPHAEGVRIAAARWARAAADGGHLSADVVDRALRACAADPLAPELAAACEAPALPPLDALADVHAFDVVGRRRLAERVVALRFSDGSVLVTRTDRNAHLRLARAPRGPLFLEDPASSPLEP